MKKIFLSVFLLCLCAANTVHAAEIPAGARSEKAKVNGIEMHYVIAGKGPMVVLLHGWPQTWYKWRHIIPALSDKYTVVAPDLRGLGETEHTKGGYDKKTISEDIVALIKHLGAEKAAVVGHDMGGKVAWLMGQTHPEIVDKLVLIDCMPLGTENMDSAKGGMWHYGFHMAKDFPEMLTKGREREYISAQLDAWTYNKKSLTNDALDEYARHYSSEGGMTAGFNYYRALLEDRKYMATLPPPKFTMPVLTIGGRHSVGDKLFQIMESQAPNLTGAVSEKSGHFVPEEDPALVAKELRQFLAK
jgi:pimeloyl-ACP methyl ester carboxylesterase